MTERSGQSPAKINLTLRVGGLRSDGFHEIESLVALVGLADDVTVWERAASDFTVECDDPTIPCDDGNLAVRAARLLASEGPVERGAHIVLHKRIPSGAGLGGGSSNAATTLRLLNELWGLRMEDGRLAQMGAALGSDVPLFFHGPMCVVRGRGERVEHIAMAVSGYVALVLPKVHCATPAIYAAWDRLKTQPPRPELSKILECARGGSVALMDLLFNDLEAAAFAVVPELGEFFERVQRHTGLAVRMTGSGAALFRLFDDEAAARAFAGEVSRELSIRTEVVRMLGA